MTGRIALPISIVATVLALAARMPQANAQAVEVDGSVRCTDTSSAAYRTESGAEARYLRRRFPTAAT
jgi:hypothetical protein